MSDNPIRVLEILPGNRAIISTEGFCRLVIRDTGEVYDEFVELPMAHMLTGDDDFLEAISYPTGQTLRFDNRLLSKNDALRSKQLWCARVFGEPKPSKAFRGKKKDRVKGFRRGRLLNPEVMAAIIPAEPREGGAA